jgi:hypothetical protein
MSCANNPRSSCASRSISWSSSAICEIALKERQALVQLDDIVRPARDPRLDRLCASPWCTSLKRKTS